MISPLWFHYFFFLSFLQWWTVFAGCSDWKCNVASSNSVSGSSCAVYNYGNSFTCIWYLFHFDFAILPSCHFVAYFKVIRIVRHHQQQIQAHELSHNFGQPSIDFAKYKRSVMSILYIMIVFYVGYLPMIVTSMALIFFGKVSSDHGNLNHLTCTDISFFIT